MYFIVPSNGHYICPLFWKHIYALSLLTFGNSLPCEFWQVAKTCFPCKAGDDLDTWAQACDQGSASQIHALQLLILCLMTQQRRSLRVPLSINKGISHA